MHPTEYGMLLWFNGILCGIGFALHFLSKWQDYRTEVKPVGLVAFIDAKPVQAAIAVFSAAAAFLLAWSMGWMNPGMGFVSGYAANSVIDNVVKRAQDIKPRE